MLLLLFFSLFMSQDLSLPGFPKYNDIVVEIRNNFGKELKINYKYQIIGTGGGIENGVYSTGWHIVAKRKVNLNQARKEYLGIIEELLKRINNDKRMKAHLKDKILTFKNIDLVLGYEDPEYNAMTCKNDIGMICKKDNIIRYDIRDDTKPWGYDDFHRETYEEALKILQEEKLPK